MNAMVSEIGSARAPWVSAGVNVFPCNPADKQPLAKWGTPSEDGWAAAWRHHPTAMAGLDCGRHDVVVIDCDCKHGIDGEGAFRALTNTLGIDISSVPTVRTPSGGIHFYFAAPNDTKIKNSASKLASGVDVRAKGGFVVGPGSVNGEGRAYAPVGVGLRAFIEYIATKRLPMLPPALTLRITSPDAYDELSAGVTTRWTIDDACARVASAVEGTRNDALSREAFIAGLRVAAGAISEDLVRQKLGAAAATTGLAAEEIDRTIDGAIARAANGGGITTTADPNRLDAFEPTGAKGVKPSLRNARAAVEKLGIVARRDVFADEIRLSNADGFDVLRHDHRGKLTDPALVFIRGHVRQRFAFDPGKEHLFDAIAEAAEDARFNPVVDWLDGLRWDGTSRLLRWLPETVGTDLCPLYARAGLSLLLAMVARARYPGTKFDLCLVLEGAQGIGKSTLLKALCSGPGDTYHTDVPGLLAMQPKEKGETLAGKWVVELAELSGLTRSDVENVKAFLSQSFDRYRAAYGRVAKDQARACVIVATTNAGEYLMDRSGNRRFLPVPCSKVDLAGIRRHRDQLFAEADHILRKLLTEFDRGRVNPGQPLPDDVAEKLGLPKSVWQDAAAVVENRLVTDAVEEAIREMIDTPSLPTQVLPDGRVFIGTATLLDALRIRGVNASARALPDIMSRLGWERAQAGTKDARRKGFARAVSG